MKRLLALLLCLAGVALILLGLLFLVGSRGMAHRLLAGVAGAAAGAVALGVGIGWARRLRRREPDYLRAEILALAERRRGELAFEELQAALGPRFDDARPVIAALQAEGTCRRTRVEGGDYLVFDDLLARLAVRRCQYCGAELPLDEDIASCPNCGGTIETRVEKLSLSGDEYFDMDG